MKTKGQAAGKQIGLQAARWKGAPTLVFIVRTGDEVVCQSVVQSATTDVNAIGAALITAAEGEVAGADKDLDVRGEAANGVPVFAANFVGGLRDGGLVVATDPMKVGFRAKMLPQVGVREKKDAVHADRAVVRIGVDVAGADLDVTGYGRRRNCLSVHGGGGEAEQEQKSS